MKARTLDCANMNKHVRPTIVRLNKAEAFLAVEPLHNTRCHFPSPMLAKQVVAHTTCEQIRSSDVLGKKPYRAWPSRQPDSSNVVNSTRFWQNRHKNNIRTALVAVGSSQPPSSLRDPCRLEPALSMTAASSAQDGCGGEQQPALRNANRVGDFRNSRSAS